MYRFILPQQVYLYSVSALSHERLRKEAQRIQLQDIGEPKYHFLDAGRLQLGQLVADRIWIADQRACCGLSTAARSATRASASMVRTTSSAVALSPLPLMCASQFHP